MSSILAVVNFDLVSNLQLASETTQPHTVVADIQRVREMTLFTPSDPESHWHDRFGSLRSPFPCAKSRHIPRSLRVSVIIFVVIIVIFFAVAFVFVFLFLFLFFLVWLLSKEDIGSYY
jgi:hypothetical protein